jgi:methionyl-tRNA formyltransferase
MTFAASESESEGQFMRVVMMGTGTFAEPTFEALLASRHQVVGLVTQPDRAMGEKRGSTRQVGKGMKEIALERGIPVLQPESINTPEGVAALQNLKPDLLVVAAYGQILSRDVLGTPPKGGINVHASLLPKYRGAAPVAWAIWKGERETGVCIIRMTLGLDAGDILARGVLAIEPHETAGELEGRLGPLGAGLAIGIVDRLETGIVAGETQDKSQATKAPKLTKEMGLIDWSQPAVAVANQIRALQPWPTAYTFLHRPEQPPLRVIIAKSEAIEAVVHSSDIPVGSISLGEGTTLRVRCGDGSLKLLELQPAGKRKMNPADFVRGNALPDASFFGPEKLGTPS